MKTKFWLVWPLLVTIYLSGCGNDPSLYRGETLTFESPVSAKSIRNSKNVPVLELTEEAASDFHITRFGAMLPLPYPLPIFDYYAEPIPIQVPVNPYYGVIQFLPPMYWDYYFNPAFSDDDF